MLQGTRGILNKIILEQGQNLSSIFSGAILAVELNDIVKNYIVENLCHLTWYYLVIGLCLY